MAALNQQQKNLIISRCQSLIQQYSTEGTEEVGIVKGMACSAMTPNDEMIEIHIEVVRDESRFMNPLDIELIQTR